MTSETRDTGNLVCQDPTYKWQSFDIYRLNLLLKRALNIVYSAVYVYFLT